MFLNNNFMFRFVLILLLLNFSLFSSGKKDVFDYNFKVSGDYEKAQIVLSWHENVGVESYYIYKSTKPFEKRKPDVSLVIAKVSNSSFYVDKLKPQEMKIDLYYALVINERIVKVQRANILEIREAQQDLEKQNVEIAQNETKAEQVEEKVEQPKPIPEPVLKTEEVKKPVSDFIIIDTKNILIKSNIMLLNNFTFSHMLNLYNDLEDNLLEIANDMIKKGVIISKENTKLDLVLFSDDEKLKDIEKSLENKDYRKSIENSFLLMKKEESLKQKLYFYIAQSYYFDNEPDIAYSYFNIINDPAVKTQADKFLEVITKNTNF